MPKQSKEVYLGVQTNAQTNVGSWQLMLSLSEADLSGTPGDGAL